MSANRTKTIIIDTNILLHYKRVDQIDWAKELGAYYVILIITPVVMKEMEKQKALHPSKQIRKRAGDLMKWMNSQIVDDSLQAEIRSNTSLKVLDAEPTVDFESNSLNQNIEDDRLIAHALQWREHHPDAPATILTADSGVRMKAMGRKLPVILWEDNEHRLPDEEDPEQKKIRSLEAKLRKYESREPELSLQFSNGEKHCEISLPEYSNEQVEAKMSEIKQQIRLDVLRKSDAPASHLLDNKISTAVTGLNKTIESLIGVTDEDKMEYNAKLKEYYKQYNDYLEEQAHFRCCVIRLNIQLVNRGACAAENVDIKLVFPDYLQISAEYDLSDEPKPPQLIDRKSLWYSTVELRPPLLSGVFDDLKYKDIDRPYFDSPNSVSYQIANAKRVRPIELGCLYVDYGVHDVLGFTINCTLSADNCVGSSKQNLYVKAHTSSASVNPHNNE